MFFKYKNRKAKEGNSMPRRNTSKHTNKRKRQLKYIQENDEEDGMAKRKTERTAWASINKMSNGRSKNRIASHSKRKSKKKIYHSTRKKLWGLLPPLLSVDQF